jgi:hypothetical protein
MQDNVLTNPFYDDAGSNNHEYLTLESITMDVKDGEEIDNVVNFLVELSE